MCVHMHMDMCTCMCMGPLASVQGAA